MEQKSRADSLGRMEYFGARMIRKWLLLIVITAFVTFKLLGYLDAWLEKTSSKPAAIGIGHPLVLDGEIFKKSADGQMRLVQPQFLSDTFQLHFVSSDRNSQKIPKIIHQIWDTHAIQGHYHKWVQSWLQVNPGWQYWLWSIDDGRQLVEKYFPDYLTLFESYPSTIHRADVMRYFIIYKYGGLYMDLDMKAIQPMDNWTSSYDCFLSEEPYEHPYIVRSSNFSNIVNGVLGCRQNHPFYKLVIESLFEYARNYFADFLHATGPHFLDEVLIKYNSQNNLIPLNQITIVPPAYFLPTFDPTEGDVISWKCLPKRLTELSEAGQKLCHSLMLRSYSNKPGPEAYTDHYWVHANMYDDQWKAYNTKSIHELVPSATNITIILHS